MAITPAGRGTAPIGARDSPDAREGADIDTKDRATTAEPVDGATATPDSAHARHRWWHLTPPGLSVALIAVCLSLTPSLLPRSGLIQGLVCGIAAAIGYGLGVVGAKNYIEAITGGAVFVREKWNTPMGEVYPVKIDDLGEHLGRVQQATLKLYAKTARMNRRDLIWNGQYVYYVDMILPHMRLAGTYEKACRDYDLWEVDQRIANYYYDITKRGFAQETVPQKIFSGAGYLPFSDGADRRRSKYRWL